LFDAIVSSHFSALVNQSCRDAGKLLIIDYSCPCRASLDAHGLVTIYPPVRAPSRVAVIVSRLHAG
jgi:hypothetical protein